MRDQLCPRCGERTAATPVQHVDLGPGARYEVYVCDRCGASFQREEGEDWKLGSRIHRMPRTA